MVNSHYTILPTSENGTFHSRQRCTQLVWRTFRQRQTVIRRAAVAIIVVLLVCAGSIRLFRATAWLSVPKAPPTPFVLKGLPSPHSKLTDALDLAAPFPAPRYRPACAPMSSINPRYASLSSSQSNSTIYLALNLLDAQSILPTFIHELPVLLSFMGSHRFHVSILENGSTDLTPGLLVLLARALTAVGSSYEIIVQGEGMKSNKAGGRRIVELARLRNDAMESLFNGEAAKQLGIKEFDMILFMNDIFWCAGDMLEIINQHVVQGSHMTCATDWEDNVVYDRWVARTMSGQPFYSQEDMFKYFGIKGLFLPLPRPFPYDDHERTQFENLYPFQVFSCWNGAAVIDPRAFFATPLGEDSNNGVTRHQSATEYLKDKAEENPHMPLESLDLKSDAVTRSVEEGGVLPRSSNDSSLGIRFRTARNDVSPITEKASECFLICVDLWRKGMGRIMMAPKSSVAYKLAQYEKVRQDGGRTVRHPIGLEPHVHSGTAKGDKNDDESDAIRSSMVTWSPTPPTNVIYHDYSWWREPERWGPWDEA